MMEHTPNMRTGSQATLTLEDHPEGVEVTMGGDARTLAIPAGGSLIVGMIPDAEVYIRCVDPGAFHRLCQGGWGGRKNLRILFHDGVWKVLHLGHIGIIRVNGQAIDRVGEHTLADGDRIEPALGLVFRFRLS